MRDQHQKLRMRIDSSISTPCSFEPPLTLHATRFYLWIRDKEYCEKGGKAEQRHQLPSLDGLFESYSRLVVKHRRPILAIWAVIVVLMVPFALDSANIVSYSINIPTSNNQSQIAENIVSTQFSSYQQPDNTYYVIMQGQNVLTPGFYQKYQQLNQTLFNSLASAGLKNVTSVYSLEYSLISQLSANIPTAFSNTSVLVNHTAQALTELGQNLSAADLSLHQIYLEAQNSSARLIYGIPSGYLSVWSSIFTSPSGSSMSTPKISSAANASYIMSTGGFGGSQPALAYYSGFYSNWYSETQGMTPSSVEMNLIQMGSGAVNKTVPQYIASENLNQTESTFIQTVAGSFNLTDFASKSALDSVTLGIFTSGLPQTQATMASQAFSLGRDPSATSLVNLATYILSQQIPSPQLDFTLGAYYSSLNDSLASYSINYFVRNLIANDPSLTSTLSSSLNLTLQEFATYAYSIGVPENSTLLHSYQKSILGQVFSSNYTLSNAIMKGYN